MNEYIEKQELIDTLNKSQWFTDILCTKTNTYDVLYVIGEFLDKQPTVTQADLVEEYLHQTDERGLYDAIKKRVAREFAEKLILNISESLIWNMLVNMNSNYSDTADNIVDYFCDSINDLLKEMGCCDEKTHS